MAARSPLDRLQGILPVDAAIARMQKHEMKEYIYSLGEQLAHARQILKNPPVPKDQILINKHDLPASFWFPIPEDRIIGETQRIESIVSPEDAMKCAETVLKTIISQKKA